MRGEYRGLYRCHRYRYDYCLFKKDTSDISWSRYCARWYLRTVVVRTVWNGRYRGYTSKIDSSPKKDIPRDTARCTGYFIWHKASTPQASLTFSAYLYRTRESLSEYSLLTEEDSTLDHGSTSRTAWTYYSLYYDDSKHSDADTLSSGEKISTISLNQKQK